MISWKRLGLCLAASGALAMVACVSSTERATAIPPTTVAIPTSTTTAAPSPTSSPVPTPTAAPVPTPTPVTPVATATPTAASTPAATPSPTPTAAVINVGEIQRFGLFLEIEGLSEESVVRGDSVVARGRTSPDALVSINGVIVPVDAEGNFEVMLVLDPGPNLIEVVASDLDGNEMSQVLAVVSLPEGEAA